MTMRALVGLLVLGAAVARGQVTTVGEVIVVPDATGSIHQRVTTFGFPALTPAQGLACQDASRVALGVLADQYDFLVVFLSDAVNGPSNTPAFQQARVTAQGIAQNPLFNDGTPFGSRATLKGCVFMGSALRLPADPDALAGDLGSGRLGLTAMEVLGHEVGHSWLVAADYDEGAGKMEDLRSGDRHYAIRVDSRSVMFGSCIDPLGGGVFRVTGCPRKYNSMDQYFMGLVPPSAVQPLLLVWGQGSSDPLAPLAPTAAPVTIMGSERRVGIDAVVRQMGARSPSYPAAQRCFRTGFVYVTRGPATSEALLKVDGYRRRFETWFSWATDGHGAVDTRALGAGCREPAADAGVAPTDAGLALDDDAGFPGGTELGVPDGGAASRREDPGSMLLSPTPLRQTGCGCSSFEGALSGVALLVALARSRPGRRRACR
jgi:hypothetical protein